jgi:hypothetical protein
MIKNSMDAQYWLILLENLLTMANGGRNTQRCIYIFLYIKAVTPSGNTSHLSTKQY